jgi:hypothetical protein
VIAALEDVEPDHPGVQSSIEEIQGTLTAESNWTFSMLYKNGPNRNAHRALLGMSVTHFLRIPIPPNALLTLFHPLSVVPRLCNRFEHPTDCGVLPMESYQRLSTVYGHQPHHVLQRHAFREQPWHVTGALSYPRGRVRFLP